MFKASIDDKEVDVHEMSEWTSSFSDNFKIGDYVCSEIAWELINCVPPANFGQGYFQMGEPASHREDEQGNLKPTYLTLLRVDKKKDIWQYLGNCFFNGLKARD